MDYICQSCGAANPPKKWYFFGTVCPECNQSYKPNDQLAPYYTSLIGMTGVKGGREGTVGSVHSSSNGSTGSTQVN